MLHVPFDMSAAGKRTKGEDGEPDTDEQPPLKKRGRLARASCAKIAENMEAAAGKIIAARTNWDSFGELDVVQLPDEKSVSIENEESHRFCVELFSLLNTAASKGIKIPLDRLWADGDSDGLCFPDVIRSGDKPEISKNWREAPALLFRSPGGGGKEEELQLVPVIHIAQRLYEQQVGVIALRMEGKLQGIKISDCAVIRYRDLVDREASHDAGVNNLLLRCMQSIPGLVEIVLDYICLETI